MRHLNTLLLASVAAGILTSCAVGPDFKTPAAPAVKRFTDTDMPDKTTATDGMDGAAQSFAQGKDIPADWWTQFNSPALNALMTQALKANPDLKAASASLRQAKETYMASRGEFFPSVDASFAPTREKFNSSAYGLNGFPSSIFTLYDASVSVSYTFDVFGGVRRSVEAAHAQVDYQRYEFQAAYLTLTANVVTAAVQEASLREQIKETQHIIDIEGKQLNVLKKQFELGGAPKSTELQQEATLAQQQAKLPTLQKQLAQTHNQLAVLAGTFPGNGGTEEFDLGTLHLPEEIPVTLPSKLVEQRPDIKASEAQLHTASAEVGVATANMLPQFTLSGTYAYESTKFRNLINPGAEAWSLGGSILQPLFEGGTLLHEKRAASAALEKAQAQYESTVLQAFENVADSLRALQYDADGLAAQVNAERAAKNSLDLSQTQFKLGAVSYPLLLDAQNTYAQTRISLVQAQAARLSDTVALFQSLGGGWQSGPTQSKPVTPPPAAPKQAEPPAVTPVKTDSTTNTQPPIPNEKKS